MGVSEGSDERISCSAGKLAYGKSHFSELSVTTRTKEGRKLKLLSICL